MSKFEVIYKTKGYKDEWRINFKLYIKTNWMG